MPWIDVNKHNGAELELEINGYSLVKWKPHLRDKWCLYKTKHDWQREDRLLEIPGDTSIKDAKRLAIEFLMDKLNNSELEELTKEVN